MNDNLLITMSGGTTNVINATLAGIIQKAQEVGCMGRIYAGCPGIRGALEGSVLDLTDLDGPQLERLYWTAASGFIGTTRIRPLSEEQILSLAEMFDAWRIRYFINIGGNGTIKQSMAVSEALSGRVHIASVAKTVDNDLGDELFESVLYTPGYPSCANYWRNKVWMMNQENLGACEHDKVIIAQTFGRKTGFLAGCGRLADPDRRLPLLILCPEDQRPVEELMGAIDNAVSRFGRAMIVMSEGYEVGDLGERYDLSGQVMYGTSRTTAAQILVNLCTDAGIQARAFIPGFDQRSEIHFVSGLDLERAYRVGQFTVEQLAGGVSDFLGSIARSRQGPGEVDYRAVPFDEIDDYSRVMPSAWLLPGEYDVSDAYVQYAEPLLETEAVTMPKSGGKLIVAVRPQSFATADPNHSKNRTEICTAGVNG